MMETHSRGGATATRTWLPDRRSEGPMDEPLEGLLAEVYPWARRLGTMLAGPLDGEDLVQEAFIRVMRRPPRTLSVPVLHAWLRPTMVRLHLRRHRRLLRESALLASFRAAVPAGEPPLSSLTEEVLAALRGLPRRQRACLVLYYLEDLPESEVGALLGIRPGTVKAHLAQGRERLRRTLRAPVEPQEVHPQKKSVMKRRPISYS